MDNDAFALIMQSGERFGAMLVPRQEIDTPDLLGLAIGMKQRGCCQLKEFSGSPQIKPLPQFCAITSRQLRFVACCENSSCVFTRRDCPQQNPTHETGFANTMTRSNR